MVLHLQRFKTFECWYGNACKSVQKSSGLKKPGFINLSIYLNADNRLSVKWITAK